MAKTYIDIVKYMVEARFEISGLVEKPDIIGAVFGQTEGLLGNELDLRELQKNGKIGRIEIDTQAQGNKTVGRLHLPSSLGKVETCILAAAIESVDRVGPFETTFKVDRIDDTRNEKRRKIVNRAKELVKILLTTGIPDSREISDMVEEDVKTSVVTEYGQEKLAAGPDIDSSDDIVLVEGRADVVTLLKSDITNCIAIGGATGNIPKTIVDLINKKETTLFLDGDRGGDIILKGIMNAGDVDFVARAPSGKEVEELQRKEIIKALRSRVPIEQMFPGKKGHGHAGNAPVQSTEERPQLQRQQRQPPIERERERPRQMQQQQAQYRQQQPQQILSPSEISNNLQGNSSREPGRDESGSRYEESSIKDIRGGTAAPSESIPSMFGKGQGAPSLGGTGQPNPNYVAALEEPHNTLRGRLYNQNGEVIAEVPIRELIQSIQDTRGVHAVVFDGIITQRLVELANRSGIRELYGIRASQVTRTYDTMILYTKEHGRV